MGAAGAATASVSASSQEMPETEIAFWHQQYRLEPYFVAGRSFDQYSPAYQLGWRTAQSGPGKMAEFEAMDRELNQQWLNHHGSSLLEWNQVKLAVKAAWSRGIQPQQPDVLSLAAGKKLALALEAAYQFRESSVSYLAKGSHGMHSEALRRFAAVSVKMLAEQEALPVRAEYSLPFVAGRNATHRLPRWRDSGFMASDCLQDVLLKLQNWLSAVEALYLEVLPAQARKLLQHHMMVLRGQLQSLQWLSHGQA